MPELPDLQVFSQNLQKQVAGYLIEEINLPVANRLNVDMATLRKALVGQRIKSVFREGKELHFLFENGHVLALHLMLNGELFLFEGKNFHKNVVIELLFSNGKGLVMTDYRGMATPTLDPEIKTSPDALAEEVNFDFFKKLLGSRKAAIKNILIDQKLIRGIGNAYADEILWEARISPFSLAYKIPEAKIRDLVKSIRAILLDAEKQILKSHPDIISGEVRDFMKVHGPALKISPTGAAVMVKKIGSRKTYYTEEQALFI